MKKTFDLDDPTLRDCAVSAARGDRPFDVLITGARIADILTGELRAADIGICGALIASVHAPGTRNEAPVIYDATGLIATPGLIDSHMHVESSMVTPEIYAAAILPRGVTTIVWDPHEFGNVAGIAGMDYALKAAERSDLRILPLVPSCVPSAPGYETTGADFTAEIIGRLMERPGIAGLAEVMDMVAVTNRTPRMRAILDVASQSRKMICGHARSLSGSQLQAYITSGVTSDHEVTSANDLLEKLRTGLTLELRSSHPYLLKDFAETLQALAQMPATVTFCSDDVFPDDLLATGGVDNMLRLMVGHGLDPLRAVQAATLNPTIRLGRSDIGLIGPGKRADIVLFEDLIDFKAVHVFRNGKPIDKEEATSQVPSAFLKTVDLSPIDPSSFTVKAQGPHARVAVIAKPRFTKWDEAIVNVLDGVVVPPSNSTMIAVINRFSGSDANPTVGFLSDWGDWDGAFATTISHDSHNLTVFGSDADQMAIAANALIAAGGGMAVVHQYRVIAILPLPVAGLVSTAPLAEVAADFATVRVAMDQVVTWQPPYLTFKALVGATLACNPGPHQTDLGIADPHSGKLLRSPVLEDGLN
mgnify:CR=1 FL=1